MNPGTRAKKAQKKQMRVLYMATLVLLLPIFASITYLYVSSEDESVVEMPLETVRKVSVDLGKVPTTAQSAFVISLNDGSVMYQKFPDKQLPLASLTKLITAKVADDQAVGNTVTVRKMDDPTYGDAALTQGQQWDREELTSYTLVTSSNDGAHTLRENSTDEPGFIDSMNRLAASIGLASTRFYNETGLDNDEARIAASKGTAKDVTKLLSYLVKNDLPIYEKTKYASPVIQTPSGQSRALNTNEATGDIVGLLVSKTGYTDLAGGNLAIVADMGLNEPAAFVVLHSSKESRFDDVVKLQKEYFAQVAQGMR